MESSACKALLLSYDPWGDMYSEALSTNLYKSLQPAFKVILDIQKVLPLAIQVVGFA